MTNQNPEQGVVPQLPSSTHRETRRGLFNRLFGGLQNKPPETQTTPSLINDATPSRISEPTWSRRRLLRAAAAASVLAVPGAALAGCGPEKILTQEASPLGKITYKWYGAEDAVPAAGEKFQPLPQNLKEIVEEELGKSPERILEYTAIDPTQKDNPCTMYFVDVLRGEKEQTFQYVLFRDNQNNYLLDSSDLALGVDKDRRILVQNITSKQQVPYCVYVLNRTLPENIRLDDTAGIKSFLADSAQLTQYLQDIKDPQAIDSLVFFNPVTQAVVTYSRKQNPQGMEVLFTQILGILGPTTAYAEELPTPEKVIITPTPLPTPLSTPRPSPTVVITKAPEPTAPPTTQPSSTLEATEVPPTNNPAEATPTATVPTAKTPEATGTPALSELLKQAPEIAGLKKDLLNGQVVYYAEKGNQWGLKEGELAGRFFNYERVSVANLNEVTNTKTEAKKGLSLHPEILQEIYLKENTASKLAAGQFKKPFEFDPEGRKFTLYESLINNHKYMVVTFEPKESIVGLEFRSVFPGSSEIHQAANVDGKMIIIPSEKFAPQGTKLWAVAIFTRGFKIADELTNKIINATYGQLLFTVSNEGNITSIPGINNVQLLFTIETQNEGGKSYGFDNILENQGCQLFILKK